MSRIIKLDKNLSNQIAAGEVVERPLCVVKELVENSIDSGATNIKVELFEGGIKEIIVSDNGGGIEKDDLTLAVEKYSTSKIKDLEDLYNVLTFGFRGEALASISSISDMTIISKTEKQKSGYKLEIIAGEKKDLVEIPSSNGTKIIVKNLFYNTPARLNYLKKPRTEYNHIYKYLQSVSLSYPEIGFEFLNEGKEVFKYRQKEDLKTRIYNIFSEDFLNNLIDLKFEISGLKITGFISNPKVSFTNRNRQILFVNKRPIKSPLIIKAINDAYNRFIPHNNFPAYILNLKIDPSLVDVNVHPRKLEVRFADEKNIFRSFYHSIEEKLNSVSLYTLTDTKNTKNTKNSEKNDILYTLTDTKNIKENEILYTSTDTKIQKSDFKVDKNLKYYTPSGTKFKSYSPYTNTSPNPNQTKISDSLSFTKEILNNNYGEENDFFKLDNIDKNNLKETKLGKIVGQIHNSYIIVETDFGIQILDQHALAERIIYEKLVNSKTNFKSQALLISQNLTLTPLELDILKENKEIFYDMGFSFEILSANNIILNSIPDFIKKENLKNIFLGVLSDLENSKKSKTLEEVRNKIFAYTACRSAIKFGHKLSLFEINKLLNDSIADYSSTCPHGRPVVYNIDLDELKGKYER